MKVKCNLCEKEFESSNQQKEMDEHMYNNHMNCEHRHLKEMQYCIEIGDRVLKGFRKDCTISRWEGIKYWFISKFSQG